MKLSIKVLLGTINSPRFTCNLQFLSDKIEIFVTYVSAQKLNEGEIISDQIAKPAKL